MGDKWPPFDTPDVSKQFNQQAEESKLEEIEKSLNDEDQRMLDMLQKQHESQAPEHNLVYPYGGETGKDVHETVAAERLENINRLKEKINSQETEETLTRSQEFNKAAQGQSEDYVYSSVQEHQNSYQSNLTDNFNTASQQETDLNEIAQEQDRSM